MKHATILGLGEWRPETRRSNDAWPSQFRSDALGAEPDVFLDVTTRAGDPCAPIVQRYLSAEQGDPFVGTHERRIADPAVTPADAQAHAARAAMADANVAPEQIDFVLSHGFLPDRPAVPGAPRVMNKLGLKGATGIDVDNAYATAVSQLLLASALVETGRARHVLVTHSHLITRAVPASHRASPNFGDLAAAIVVGPSQEPGILADHSETHAEYADALAWTRTAPEAGSPWWEEGGAFTLASLDRRGTQEVIAYTVRRASDAVRDACSKAGVATSAIAALCTVQPRAWIPAAIAEAAGMPEGRAPNTFRELAHVGACGVVANLLEARRTGLVQRGEVVALYAQGAGLTRMAALLRWTRSA